MNGLQLSSEEPSADTSEIGNPTYFIFAAATPVESVAGDKCIGPLPDVLSGRYRLDRLLGAGGMGSVYRAWDLLHEQFGDPAPLVAVKILNEDFSESPDAGVLLYSEFALTRLLRHPNIVRLHNFEVDIACQRAYIVMELMPGLTLDRLLCECPIGLPWSELVKIIVPLLEAVAYVHERGVLHGDLKPSNVMLSEEGVRLFDFGLGQAGEGVLLGLPQLSRERFNAWTPSYAAPELLEGGPLSTAADVYALACVLYELAGGKHPFRRLSSIEAREGRLERELKPPRYLPRNCWPALRKALSFDVARRDIGADELRAALAAPKSRLRYWFSVRSP